MMACRLTVPSYGVGAASGRRLRKTGNWLGQKRSGDMGIQEAERA